jgi:RNA polymerase sigma factor (sigma-70 family)
MATGPLAPVVHYLRKVTSPAPSGELPDAELLARFARQREEAAFTTLVRRHGPMVLAVCRRVARDGHAADDAFQATFLVLARKAASLAQPELLGNWLHGVAYRTAMKARREAAKRRAYEMQTVRAQAVGPNEDIDMQDLRAVLDEEINRLPERYRVAVVLCYLQDHTNAEAARRLGCSRGSVATLLARARDKLRRRLTQRGIGLSIGVALGAAPPVLRGETVPLALEKVTVKAATLLAAGHTQAAGALAAQTVALAKGVSKGMLMERLKIPVAILMMTTLVGTGAGVSAYRAGDPVPVAAEAPVGPKPISQHKSEDRKRLDDKRSDEPSPLGRKVPAAPQERFSFREKLPLGPDHSSQILVVLDEEGRLIMAQDTVFYEPVTEEATTKSGRKVGVTTYQEKHQNAVSVRPLDKVRVYDTKGRKVDAKELRKRLAKETLALLWTCDRPLDPLYLRLYKEDTLVFDIDRDGLPGLPPGVAVPAPAAVAPPAAMPAPTILTPPPPVVTPVEIVPPSES